MKFRSLKYPIKTLPNGDTLELNSYHLTSATPGPHVHIQASVHGAEVQGNAVLFHLLDFLSKNEFKGGITLIPTANPMGINNKAGTFTQGRFNALSGNNWNRNYQDLEDYPHLFSPREWLSSLDLTAETKSSLQLKFKEYLKNTLMKLREEKSRYFLSDDLKLNLTLQQLASDADIVLDLHTGPRACRYLYAAEFQKEKVKDLPFPFTIIIPNEFAGAMDEATFMPWVLLSHQLKEMGFDHLNPHSFEAYTVELGSEEQLDLQKAFQDSERILSFLAKRGVITEDFQATHTFEQQRAGLLKDYKTYYAPHGALYEYLMAPGEYARLGRPLCRSLNFNSLQTGEDLKVATKKCLDEVKLQADAYIINHGPSAVVSEGQPLYQVLEHTWLL